MTLIAPERQSARPALADIPEMITPTGLDSLKMLINRALTALVVDDDPLLDRVVSESIEAFVAYDGAPWPAASQVAPLLWELGNRHARLGFDLDSLTESFRRAQLAAQKGLPFAVGAPLPHEEMTHLREDVLSFLRYLHSHAWIGWERTRVILAMQDDQCRDRLGPSLLGSNDPPMLDMLAEFSGIDLASEYVVVVSAADGLPDTLLDHPEILATDNPCEALAPAGWSLARLTELLSTQVVVGPPSPLAGIAETVGLTRRGAELLREGLTSDPRTAVPCTDLLASLVIDGNPRLTNLLVAKHLNRMNSLTARRRATTGELLLHWLERGLPVNKLARDLGIPAQTAHSRMKYVRELFGDTLDDPAQRLELMVALQAVLPRWRAEAERS